MTHSQLDLPDGRRIAYHRCDGTGPTAVFLGGFRSDMTGTKATFLENHARRSGRAFLRFDYTGHGASSGRFADGTIGVWTDDAASALEHLTAGPVVLVGSSMGGWIALLLARRCRRVVGIIGIATAPDFTEDLIWARFNDAQRRELESRGFIEEPSDYAPEPDLITRALLEDGREHLVLRSPLCLSMPVRLLHGTADEDVPPAVALRLLDHAEGPDIRLTLVKGADHRFSTSACLALVAGALDDFSSARRKP